MTLDRKGRDETASVLLAYMRGELAAGDFSKRLLPIASSDKSLVRVREALIGFPDDFDNGPISASPEAWAGLLRVLAFLRTDLDLEPIYVLTDRRRRRLAAAGLVIIAAAAALSWPTGLWGILAIVWLAVGAAWALWAPPPEPEDRLQELKKFWPFRTESEWLEHEPLLHGLDIPRYQPEARVRPPYREEVFSAAAREGIWAITGPFVLLMAIASARRTVYLTKAKEPPPGAADVPRHDEQ